MGVGMDEVKIRIVWGRLRLEPRRDSVGRVGDNHVLQVLEHAYHVVYLLD